MHDEDTKTIREDKIQAFKDGKIDLLIVYNMLLTSFDAPILKKLYLTRVIKAHNLLQTLTRINRPYKNFKYGYIVDFVNIKDEFDKTNRLYWEELQNELGDKVENYSRLFKTSEEIEKELSKIEEYLFEFDVSNLEIFSQQIRGIEDIDKENIPVLEEIYKKVKALNRANERLAKKYKNDKKYAKIHKTLKSKLSAKETEIQRRLFELKGKVDEMVLNREDVFDNEEYFKRDMAKYVAMEFKDFGPKAQDLLYISSIITREYICEYRAC